MEKKRVKGLDKENLRDHMTEEELIFTQLAELETRKGAIMEDAQGLDENREAAQKGGKAAGAASFLSQIKAAKAKLLDN